MTRLRRVLLAVVVAALLGSAPFPPPSPADCCHDDPHGAGPWRAPSTATRPRTSRGCNQTGAGVVTNTNRTPGSAPTERHQTGRSRPVTR